MRCRVAARNDWSRPAPRKMLMVMVTRGAAGGPAGWSWVRHWSSPAWAERSNKIRVLQNKPINKDAGPDTLRGPTQPWCPRIPWFTSPLLPFSLCYSPPCQSADPCWQLMRNGATWPRENWPGVRRPEDPAVPLYQSLTMVPLTSFLFFSVVPCPACGIPDPSSPTRDRTWAPCIGSLESQPLDHPGSPLA